MRNVRSLANKMDELMMLMRHQRDYRNSSLILLAETWLNALTLDTNITIALINPSSEHGPTKTERFTSGWVNKGLGQTIQELQRGKPIRREANMIRIQRKD
ncbi:hypothetical protein ILYODFUR_018380 [Ilyodon furcidens]|uniref:Uncharacterized protein n=1 Tax=Ilyodon furcidens TaxID=33524 RepID=A0ABV0U6C6_9TELE